MSAEPPSGPQPLSPQIVHVWRIAAAIPFIAFLVPALVLAGLAGGVAWAAPVVVAGLGAAAVSVLPRLRYRRTCWLLTHDAIEYQQGIVLQRTTTIPYYRIQHIDLHDGPLDRLLGMTGVVVNTASVTIQVPGLQAETARALRAHLLERTATAVGTQGPDDAV